MPKEVEIRCDQCSSDLTYTGNSIDYRLALLVERLPIHPNARVVTDVGRYRPIEHDAYFCGAHCLAKWVSEKFPQTIEVK